MSYTAKEALELSLRISEMTKALTLDGTESVPIVGLRNSSLQNLRTTVDGIVNRLHHLISTDPAYGISIQAVQGLQGILNALAKKDADQDFIIANLNLRLGDVENILNAMDGSLTLMEDTWPI